MARELLKGNIAFAEAAVRAGLQAYFGYPITPQTEALEWLSTEENVILPIITALEESCKILDLSMIPSGLWPSDHASVVARLFY